MADPDEEFLKDFRDRMKRKRLGLEKQAVQGKTILGEIEVRKHTTYPQGVNKWYRPLGSSEFVTLECEATLTNLKKVISDFEKLPPERIDLLTKKEGPSCTSENHLADSIKEKHFMYRVLPIKSKSAGQSSKVTSAGQSSQVTKRSLGLGLGLSLKRPRRDYVISTSKRPCSIDEFEPATNPKKLQSPPASLSIDTILGMGCVMRSKVFSNIEVSEFSAEKGIWLPSTKMPLMIEQEHFSEGAFKQVYKATNETDDLFVIKRFKDSAQESGLRVHGHKLREQTKVTVQTQAVARYFAEKFSSLLPDRYFICYAPLYMGEMETDIFLIEKFIDSDTTFSKYINNNGSILSGNNRVAQDVAEAFSHFTLETSGNELMVTDIQGWYPYFIDPAIATSNLKRNGRYQFGLDNLGSVAIATFSDEHSCNILCSNLGLKSMDEVKRRSVQNENSDSDSVKEILSEDFKRSDRGK